jgi:Tol biopolymer transport system component
MSSDRRFEQELPNLLDDLFMGPMPTYRDEILQQAARTRQRPAWSFLERWLPMVDIARQPVLVSRVPWRRIGLGLVLVALLVALIAAVLVAGAHPQLPKPFGPARNGLVAYASGGDIYTVDPARGISTATVKGPETDINPRWSRDGTLLAFERKATGDTGPGFVYVVQPDGTDLIRVTPNPLSGIIDYTFSPDGKRILISAGVGGVGRPLIASTDGSQIRQLDIGFTATDAVWRPPDGSEIIFENSTDPSDTYRGIYAVNVADGKVRTILARTPGLSRDFATGSPDGSLIFYGQWHDSDTTNTIQIHIVAADGTGDRVLPIAGAAVWQAPFGWSNDGTRLIAIRGYGAGDEDDRAVLIPVDASGSGTEIKSTGVIQGSCCSVWEWAPDDSSILGTPIDSSSAALDQVLVDPVAGTSRTVSWNTVSQPSWQRLAP